jgi:hypothetical protein
MTTELPSRERSDADIECDWVYPEVLFEEARQRRRRRWKVGSVIAVAAVIAGALVLGMGGGGGHGPGNTAHGQPSGSGSGATSSHVNATRLFPGVRSSGGFYTGPGASCPLAPRNRYLPAWSGCVSTMVADVFGNGRQDLVLSYSRLSHTALGGLPPRLRTRRQASTRYPAEQAMLRIVTPDGHMITTPIKYTTVPVDNTPAKLEKADAAALISVAHVSDEPGKQIVLQTGQISSGSTAVAYSLYHSHLVSAGAVLGLGGDSGSQAGFQCVAGNPPRVIQQTYDLLRGIKAVGNTVHIYGWWDVTTTTYAWRGSRLVKVTQHTAKHRVLPSDTAGVGCTKGIA